jgi:hypothetical protein
VRSPSMPDGMTCPSGAARDISRRRPGRPGGWDAAGRRVGTVGRPVRRDPPSVDRRPGPVMARWARYRPGETPLTQRFCAVTPLRPCRVLSAPNAWKCDPGPSGTGGVA